MGSEIAYAVNRKGVVALVLALAILLSYSNSFRGGWQFDDVDHITKNKAVQISKLTADAMLDVLYAAPRPSEDSPKRIFRPLASLTLALNWYLGQDDVFGYHVFNIFLHIVSACLLFGLILSLYRSPGLRHRCEEAAVVAFSTALLWSLNPIQTQAVTYIVQRMTSMAAMFFVMGMLFYVRGRLTRSRYGQALHFSGSAIAYALALVSKENAIVMPAALLLIEFTFFFEEGVSKTFKIILILGAVAVFGGLWWILSTKAGIGRILDGYAIRPYTMFERLITQPRVLLLYVSLIFLPLPSRLSIQHDITHSMSLMDPWTTTASIVAVLVLIASALHFIRRLPILCFATLFFFVCHVVESTVIPLELVFEHRNYLPSMFIFWPVVALLLVVIKSVKVRSGVAAYAVLFLFALIPVGMGLGTYERNFAWADGFSLWEDAAAKSQKYDRPYLHLAQLHDARGDYENALEMYAQANEKYSERKSDNQFAILNNTANIFFKLGDFDKAIEIWSYAANNVKDNSIIRRNLAIANARKKEWRSAVDHLNLAIGMSPKQADLYILKSEYLSELEEYGEAITSLELAIAHGYNEKAARSAEAIAFYHMKEYEKAEQILRNSYSDSMTIEVMIWLLAINLQTDDMAGIADSRDEIVRMASEKDLTQWVNIIQEPGYHLSHNNRLISELKNILHGIAHNG